MDLSPIGSNLKPVGEAAGDFVSGICAATEATQASSANPQLNLIAMVSGAGTFRDARTFQTTVSDGI
jgi:hypothetical protein